MDATSTKQLANYRIVVLGSLDETWSDRLGGMEIATSLRDNQKPMTILKGRVRDQAQLMGVLNSLYQMHMEILLVSCEASTQV